MKKGENSQTLKRNNRALVLETVLTGGVATRVELARATGLNKMTVGNIVSDLMENGYLAEGIQAQTQSVGRKPIELNLAPDAPKVIGLSIARNGIAALLTDLKLQCIDRTAFIPFEDEDIHSVMQKAIGLVEQLMKRGDRLLGIGVGTLGQYDVNTENVLCPVDFFGIRDMPIKATLMKHFDLPVYVDNDMNCAALAEKLYGCGKEADCFLYIGITHGVGAGIVIGGELMGNSSGLAGEIGHMSIDIHGKPCSCGNRGCLELYTSVGHFEREVEKRTGVRRAFADFVRDNDFSVASVLNEGCDTLAAALAGAVNLLDPQLIIIGHEGAILPGRYLARIEENMNARVIVRDYKRVRIVRSSFGVDTALYGAASSLIRRLFDGKLLSY